MRPHLRPRSGAHEPLLSLAWPRWSLGFAPEAVMSRSNAPVELTILGTTRPLDPGPAVERDGRTFYAGRYGSKDIVVARDRPGVWIEAMCRRSGNPAASAAITCFAR